MANNFSLNGNVTTAWAAQIKAQKGVMLEPQVRKSGKGFKVVHRMPFASLLHGLLWKISKGYRNNRIEERHAFLNVLEDQVRKSYGLNNKYSSNGHRLAKPEDGKPILGTHPSASALAGNPGGSPALPSKCYEKLQNDKGPSAQLFNRINAARKNASVNRKAYMTSLHEVFLGIATETAYSDVDGVASFKQEWRKPKNATSNNKLAEACRRETVAYEKKRQKAIGGSHISEAMGILPLTRMRPLPPHPRHTRRPLPPTQGRTRRASLPPVAQAPLPPTQGRTRRASLPPVAQAPQPPTQGRTRRALLPPTDFHYDTLYPKIPYTGHAQGNKLQDSISQSSEEITVEVGTTPLLAPHRRKHMTPGELRVEEALKYQPRHPYVTANSSNPPTLREITQDIPPPEGPLPDNDLEQTLTPASGAGKTRTDPKPRQKHDGKASTTLL